MSKALKWRIVAALLVGCLVMGWVDAVLRPPYFAKSAMKILLFSLLPLLCFHNSTGARLTTIFGNPKQGLRVGFACGGAVFAVIFGGYWLVRPFFDFSGVTTSLADGLGVTGDNFLWVALYISVVNSFLEEFFFRGFGFLKLQEHTSLPFAYGYSALTFALYHVAMMIGWFSPALFLLALMGLFVGGMLFNYFCHRYQSIYVSWLIHLCANLAINGVGFVLFAGA